ncbi:hypothetical protein GC089_00805 [Cellulomonas sp. JZ18]|uniref:hypothetical protein n=1 Tax=Cellulomonas sp. JZ18 TaxID=2654191 RepID=UPI0012D3EC13|nr:hypothetical protein [Cellulomonas sp. JZ18]QGQ18075.1 hypothetical protein GC089_00805 [Cellulomonas sp. JZ18]
MGPVVTTCAGVVALLVALVVGLLAARTFLGLVTTDVLTASGAPGPSAVAAADAPGVTTATLEAGERYAVHLAYDGSTEPRLTEDVLLRAPSGTVVAADDDPAVDGSFGAGAWSVVSVSAFTAPESGTYDVAVPPATLEGARVLIAPDQDVAPFVGGILGTVAGAFGVVLIGAFGGGLVLGGVIWWVVRARARRTAGPATS